MTNSNPSIDTTGLTRKERRHVTNTERTEGMLTSWRNPARRTLLIRTLWACIAIMAAISVTSYFWMPIVNLWIVMTVVICTVWTMLRITIDSKDTAPTGFLDEFESATLLDARSTALKYTSVSLAIIALVLLVLSSVAFGGGPHLPDGHRFAYAVGGLALMGFFIGSVIPAAAMAKTMDDEDA